MKKKEAVKIKGWSKQQKRRKEKNEEEVKGGWKKEAVKRMKKISRKR